MRFEVWVHPLSCFMVGCNLYPMKPMKYTLDCFHLYGQDKRGRKEGETPPLLFYA